MFHFLGLHILRKLPPAKVVSSKNFRDHPLFMAGRGLGNRWGPPFSKKLGVGMLNMRSGGLQIFVQKIGGVVSFGYHRRKTIVIIMILTKEVENFLGPAICVQHSEILWLLLGKLSHRT